VTDAQIWPDSLFIVRHGESAGNVAADAAILAGHPVIEIATRDMDVPLSTLGERQAAALGAWFRAMPADRRPDVVITSSYLRTRHTAQIIVREAGMSADSYRLVADERLREREFGILDRLTSVGVQARFPDQFEARRHVGKFYHRPPGGESWCDVILRLRSAIEMIAREYCGRRVLIVCHSVVVLCMRYLLEHLSEEEILAIDRAHEVANCSVTFYEHDPALGPRGSLALKVFNFVAPLQEAGEPITTSPDASVAPR
jgi:probable phosphoglycerate mutase